ncbi:hypothetical protein [Flavobacterium sp. KACC 22761]|uniref:hypothetical protein n=1 Tax=Flavobacterium sp. KACC 22761 TaxID=3092665 RepID=UPI002A763565|nr:hypothetical protein [Flavobacterium sp. KACC 22761]WPO79620.1 hypothetical protein SCB73_04380 [Flavobacterium sp. KACC 22761]
MRKILLLVLLFTLASCDKDPVLIQSGIETKVYGKVTDDHDVPISNLIVKVGEYKVAATGSYIMSYNDYEFVKWADSTHTDTNGDYNFTFKTSGKGNFYDLVIGKEVKPHESPVIFSELKARITESANDMTFIGKQFEFNTNDLIRLYPCQITFMLNNIETFPIQIRHDFTNALNLIDLTANVTFKQTIYIQRYNKEKVTLSRMKNGIRQVASYEFPASNVEEITYQTVTVLETDFKDIK